MRTRFVIYLLVLAGLALSQVSLNKSNVANGPQVQVAGSAPGGVMMPPSCRDSTCGQGGNKTNVVAQR
jgi:hypothetical protein